MYRLRKGEIFLKATWKAFLSEGRSLPDAVQKNFHELFSSLQQALLTKDRINAKAAHRELKSLAKNHLKGFSLRSLFEFNVSLLFALAVAIIIRQTAFEPYEIPSGSMRPTYKETDRLVVSKTQFGLNIPLTTSHLLFDPNAVKRMGVFTFTGENMDIPNVKTRYFFLFPGYKQYIKRMIGLPGDTLYFYGGQIYGIDKNGNDISNELQKKELSYLEHIPFINIEGKTAITNSSVTIKQLNVPLAKLYTSPTKGVHYDLLIPKPSDNFDLHELFGMGNFASARIVSKDGSNCLELTHHASVTKARMSKDPFYRTRPTLHTDKSYIPLTEDHLKTLWENLYTGRFIVENGTLRRYGVPAAEARKNPYALKLKNIPDGTYEFTKGTLYKVGFQATLTELTKDHPLATFDSTKTILLFNAGIECDTRFLPSLKEGGIPPSRYAYFRNGDLYVMGAPILKKEDTTLQQFLASEVTKSSPRYMPFIDYGPPTLEQIKLYGIKVPEKHYLALGDNHAMSADSRDFGFVPEDNIRGTPSFLVWAPGGRFGYPNHGIYSVITTPRMISWTLILAGIALYKYRARRTLRELSLDAL